VLSLGAGSLSAAAAERRIARPREPGLEGTRSLSSFTGELDDRCYPQLGYASSPRLLPPSPRVR